MKSTVLFSILIFTLSINVFGQRSEEKLIKESFEAYKMSILNDKGEEAVKYVDSRTVKYYDDILLSIKNADSLSVDSLNIIDKFMVLLIRQKSTKEEILAFNGTTLMIYAIHNGMVGKNSVSRITIGETTVNSNFATGQMVINEKRQPSYFHFYKEEGLWKIDLTSLFPATIVEFEKLVTNSGKTENEFICYLLELSSGKKTDNKVWKRIQEPIDELEEIK